jgi:type I restriction enzyme S subunit
MNRAPRNGWKQTTLGELFRIKHGYAFKGEFFAAAGPYVLLTPGNFYDHGGFKFRAEKTKYYTGEVPSDFILSKGDLLVAMTEQAEGLLGSSAIIPEGNRYLHNQRLGLITELKDAELDKKFLYYLFNTRSVRAQIRASASGVKVRHTSPSRIYEVKASIPPLVVQQKIVGILSAYDDLMENNARRAKILEEMTQSLYREWFVHLRFPGHEITTLVPSPLGQIPEGWEVKRLGDVCEIIMGQSPKSEFYNEGGDGLPFHQGVTDFGKRFPTDRVYCTVENRVAQRGDILCSVRAPVGRLNIAKKKIVIGRGLCAIRSKTGNQPFVFQLLKEKFHEEDTMGGGTIFKAVTKDDMHAIGVLLPTAPLIARFDAVVVPMSRELEVLTMKNTNLHFTRDLLVPKLISCEMDLEKIHIQT